MEEYFNFEAYGQHLARHDALRHRAASRIQRRVRSRRRGQRLPASSRADASQVLALVCAWVVAPAGALAHGWARHGLSAIVKTTNSINVVRNTFRLPRDLPPPGLAAKRQSAAASRGPASCWGAAVAHAKHGAESSTLWAYTKLAFIAIPDARAAREIVRQALRGVALADGLLSLDLVRHRETEHQSSAQTMVMQLVSIIAAAPAAAPLPALAVRIGSSYSRVQATTFELARRITTGPPQVRCYGLDSDYWLVQARGSINLLRGLAACTLDVAATDAKAVETLLRVVPSEHRHITRIRLRGREAQLLASGDAQEQFAGTGWPGRLLPEASLRSLSAPGELRIVSSAAGTVELCAE